MLYKFLLYSKVTIIIYICVCVCVCVCVRARARMRTCAKSLQSCLTLCDPMDYSPPGFSVHGISHARVLEWVAISYYRRSSWPRDWTHVFCIGSGFFTTEPPGTLSLSLYIYIYIFFFFLIFFSILVYLWILTI